MLKLKEGEPSVPAVYFTDEGIYLSRPSLPFHWVSCADFDEYIRSKTAYDDEGVFLM